MDIDQVKFEINETLTKYGAFINEDADHWQCVSGLIFYRGEDDRIGFATVYGFGYYTDGTQFFEDPEAFISEMHEVFREEYGY